MSIWQTDRLAVPCGNRPLKVTDRHSRFDRATGGILKIDRRHGCNVWVLFTYPPYCIYPPYWICWCLSICEPQIKSVLHYLWHSHVTSFHWQLRKSRMKARINSRKACRIKGRQREPGKGDIDISQVGDIHFVPVLAMFQVNPVPHFDPSGDQNSLCQKWEKWVRGYELYMGASGIKVDGQKRQLFLHSAGPELQDIFLTLTNTGTTYVQARDKLTQYFTPHKNNSLKTLRTTATCSGRSLKNMGRQLLNM